MQSMPSIRINAIDPVHGVDIAGRRFGNLTVLDFNFIDPATNEIRWLCRCSCGWEDFFDLKHIRLVRSCGCTVPKTDYKFSLYVFHPSFDRLMNMLNGMRTRCHNKNNDSYYYYGERGIKVCKEWLDDKDLFIAWALANGYRDDLTIDRKDNYKDYEPSNCRFATYKEQANNKRIHQDRQAERLNEIAGLLSNMG
jgi:hypothetical protein